METLPTLTKGQHKKTEFTFLLQLIVDILMPFWKSCLENKI